MKPTSVANIRRLIDPRFVAVALLAITISGCIMDIEPGRLRDPLDRVVYTGHCVCGYCDLGNFYRSGAVFVTGSCDLPECENATAVSQMYWDDGNPFTKRLYCIIDPPEVWEKVHRDACSTEYDASAYEPCLDVPRCLLDALQVDPATCPPAGPEVPPDPDPLLIPCEVQNFPQKEFSVAVPFGVDENERMGVAASKLAPRCMSHGYLHLPPDHGTEPPNTYIPDSELRYCFLPCIHRNPDVGADAALDPPSTTSRSTIFEIPADGKSRAWYTPPGSASPSFMAYLSGRFSMEFGRDCFGGPSWEMLGDCDVAVSSLEVGTTEFTQGPWSTTINDETYTVNKFKVINEKWLHGWMMTRGVVDYDPTNVDLFATIDTVEHGVIGIRYLETEGKAITYDHAGRAAYFNFYLDDPMGGRLAMQVIGNISAEAPVARAGDDIDIPCTQDTLHLDGSGSLDRDSDISSYIWTFTSALGEKRRYDGKVVDIPVEMDQGTTTPVYLTVMDMGGRNEHDALAVSVGTDADAPVVEAVGLKASCLWPMNYRKAKFKLDRDILYYGAHDVCGHDPVKVKIVNATSSQPEYWWGDARRTYDDVTFNDRTVCMRAETSALSAEDRVYTIVLRFEDQLGNAVQKTVQVKVPKVLEEEEKAACGDLPSLDWVREDDQECMGSESQYPPAPPPFPGPCGSSIVQSDEPGKLFLPIFILLLGLMAAVLLLRRR